jgi:hypothetical protein
VVPGSKVADNRKNARNRNVSANNANARNKAEVAAKNVVAANKADDNPGYLGKKEAAGVASRRFSFCRSRELPTVPLSRACQHPDKVNPNELSADLVEHLF